MSKFRDQVAVITGASGGLGRALAASLAVHGAEVCLSARRRDALESIAAEILARGGRAQVFPADLTQDQDIHGLAEFVEQRFGRLDILILCGGAIFHAPAEQATLEQFDLQYRTNVRGHYALVQALLPVLRKHRGQIVFINSSVAQRPATAGAGQYISMKYALRALADSLREEVNAQGIRVLSIYPGRTATPLTAALFQKEGRSYRPELLLQPDDVATMVICALSLSRTAEVTDISIRPMVKSY